MKKEEIRDIVISYIEAYNNLDLERISTFLDQNIIFQNVADETIVAEVKGISSFMDLISNSGSTFTERNMELITISVEENEAFFETFFTGVLNKDINDDLKCGDKIRIEGYSEFKFNDKDLITKITDFSRTRI